MLFFCRWCYPGYSFWGNPVGIYQLLCTCIHWIWFHHYSEDHYHESGCQKCQSIYQWSDVRSGRGIHLTWLHSIQKFVPGSRTEQRQACVLSTLQYGIETCTPYAQQEHRLNSCHLCCLRRSLGFTLQDHIPNKESLSLPKQAFQACLHYYLNNACVGLVTSAEWKMAKSQRSHCMECLPLALDVLEDQIYATRMYVSKIWRNATFFPKIWEATAVDYKGWRHGIKAGIRKSEQKTNKMLGEDKRVKDKRLGTESIVSQGRQSWWQNDKANCHRQAAIAIVIITHVIMWWHIAWYKSLMLDHWS